MTDPTTPKGDGAETEGVSLTGLYGTLRAVAKTSMKDPARKDKNGVRYRISAYTLADAVGVTEKHMSQILGGKTNGSLDVWQRIYNRLGLSFVAVIVQSEVDDSKGENNE